MGAELEEALKDTLAFTEQRAAFCLAMAELYGQALIEIAADFVYLEPVINVPHAQDFAGACVCNHCGYDMDTDCRDDCAGRRARRALGIG